MSEDESLYKYLSDLNEKAKQYNLARAEKLRGAIKLIQEYMDLYEGETK